jgi:transcriptional regulator with GAF, ATPase, and Fis domain
MTRVSGKPAGAGGSTETTVVYRQDGSPVIERAQVEICIVEGPDEGKRAVIGPEPLIVGTHARCGLRLSDTSVSRRHVEIAHGEEGLRVRDLESTNGTKAGRNKISDAVVEVGTTLTLGETKAELTRMVERIPLPLSRRRRFGDLIGSSAAMRQIYALLESAAEADATVLLQGETGTGKELAARGLHDHSKRAMEPFVIVDCGAVSPTLIEAELFGHEKGAFTSADRERPGAFERAQGGTLFFDEVGELPLALQPKLLRALEQREIQRIGSSERILVDVRFVAATNRDLKSEMDAGRFREDLYYRLDVFKVVMPPLREHPEDIPMLVAHFLRGHEGTTLPQEIVERMTGLGWPGNVRELRNAVERAVVLSRGRAPRGGSDQGSRLEDVPLDTSRPFKDLKAELVDSFERRYLTEVLRRNKGNVSASARESGIDRKHLERLVRKHGLDIKSKRGQESSS